MDVSKIFGDLRPWTKGLDAEQFALLDRLMSATSTKDFGDIPAEEIRRIQEQMLRADEDKERQMEFKRATNHLEPAVSSAVFI
jgi:hypothetical protein